MNPHYGGLVKIGESLYSIFDSLTYALHSLIKLLKRYPFILYLVRISRKPPYIRKKNTHTHSKTSSLCNFCSLKLDVRKSEKMAENNVHVTCTVLTGEVDLFDKKYVLIYFYFFKRISLMFFLGPYCLPCFAY